MTGGIGGEQEENRAGAQWGSKRRTQLGLRKPEFDTEHPHNRGRLISFP